MVSSQDLPRGDDADLRLGVPEDAAVDSVRAGKGFGGEALVVVQARLLGHGGVVPADVEAALGQDEVGRDHDLEAMRVAVDDLGDLDGVLDAFEADPAAGVARERPAEEAVVEHLLHAGGREDRHHRVDERELRVVQDGRALAGVVVAEAGDDAAVLRRAGHVGVAEDVAAAVDAGALAVPEAEDALDAALAVEVDLLGAPEGGGGEILVEAGLELDVGGLELAARLPHLLVDPAERRAAVAGGVAGGLEPRRLVARLLHEEDADQRLDAAEEHGLLGEIEAVRERDVVEHANPRVENRCRDLKYKPESAANETNFARSARTTENVTLAGKPRISPLRRGFRTEYVVMAPGAHYIGGAHDGSVRDAMDWDKLQIFHAVADAGSLTHAGDTLHLSQSAVSRQIRALEESLDTTLFRRHARGLLLTEQGELLFDATRMMTKRLDAAAARIRDSEDEVYGELRVTTTTGFGTLWLAPRLHKLFDRYPNLKIDLMLEERILDLPMREADVAIRLKEPSQAELIRRRLMEVRIRLYASDAYVARYGLPTTAEELAGHRLITQSPSSPQVRAGAEFVQPFLAGGAGVGVNGEQLFRHPAGGDSRPGDRVAAGLSDGAAHGEHPARRAERADPDLPRLRRGIASFQAGMRVSRFHAGGDRGVQAGGGGRGRGHRLSLP